MNGGEHWFHTAILIKPFKGVNSVIFCKIYPLNLDFCLVIVKEYGNKNI